MTSIPSENVFLLLPYGSPRRTPDFNYLVIVPENVPAEAVAAAWAYAVRYTAKGLDLPDHDAALQKLSERHATWKIFKSKVNEISVNLALAEKDTPE